uniref:C2H2-type domain-containing protein n=1 Tax=Scleropages formosus TaxID=113540 RepID=A0A8C9VNB5_SCLFO
MELKVVQVKEEVSAAQQTSPALDTDQSKPYICGECGKSYLWLKNLKKHQKIHTGEAPFSCNICCKHFSSQQVFEEHQRVHTGDRPHRCTYCSKTFNHLSNLKKHQLIHTGEKPHHCSLCGKRFRQIQHLKEHRKTHEDSKPFRCGECGWGFNHGSNFKRHLLVHTRQKMLIACFPLRIFKNVTKASVHVYKLFFEDYVASLHKQMSKGRELCQSGVMYMDITATLKPYRPVLSVSVQLSTCIHLSSSISYPSEDGNVFKL